jgi:hypothetical protein
MIKVNYDIKSTELKKICDIEVNNTEKKKIFFSVMSKIGSLYNLSSQGHDYARLELYKIISTIDKVNKNYSTRLNTYKKSLAEYPVELETLRNLQLNIGNPVNFAFFELSKNIDLIEKYDYLVFIKTGRKNKDSMFYEYIQQIRNLITRVYSVKVKELTKKSITKKDKPIYDASSDHKLLPEIQTKQQI